MPAKCTSEWNHQFWKAYPSHFWLKVWPCGDCWEWRGERTNKGYGVVNYLNSRFAAHRVAYEELVGPIPRGMTLDHLCRNRWCVRPSHLDVVDPVTNVMRGESPIAKLARQTHCLRGHVLPEKSAKTGLRICRACRSIRKRLRLGKPRDAR